MSPTASADFAHSPAAPQTDAPSPVPRLAPATPAPPISTNVSQPHVSHPTCNLQLATWNPQAAPPLRQTALHKLPASVPHLPPTALSHREEEFPSPASILSMSRAGSPAAKAASRATRCSYWRIASLPDTIPLAELLRAQLHPDTTATHTAALADAARTAMARAVVPRATNHLPAAPCALGQTETQTAPLQSKEPPH